MIYTPTIHTTNRYSVNTETSPSAKNVPVSCDKLNKFWTYDTEHRTETTASEQKDHVQLIHVVETINAARCCCYQAFLPHICVCCAVQSEFLSCLINHWKQVSKALRTKQLSWKQANKKVFRLICTCMDSSGGLVAHTLPFRSAVIVLPLKCNDLSWSLHQPRWLNEKYIFNYTNKLRRETQFPIWHIIELAFWTELRCTSVMQTLSLFFSELTKSSVILGPGRPNLILTFTYHSFNICTSLT